MNQLHCCIRVTDCHLYTQSARVRFTVHISVVAQCTRVGPRPV